MKKAVILCIILFLVSCEQEPTKPNDTGAVLVVIDSAAATNAVTDSLDTAAKIAAPAINQLEVRILTSDNTLITSKTLYPVSGYFEGTITLKVQDNLKVLCVGKRDGIVKRIGVDDDVDIKAGATVTATIPSAQWNSSFVPVINDITPNPSVDGSYNVSWSSISDAASYTLQEADNEGLAGIGEVYSGSEHMRGFSGMVSGTYYYRVNATNVYGITSGWSDVKSVVVDLSPTTYTISGTITGADGVTVTLSGDTSDSQTVDDGGSYLFTVNSGGSYLVTPLKTLFAFTPPSKLFTNIESNQTQDFSASSISVLQYTLAITVNPSSGGSTNPTVNSHIYDKDEIVSITATPSTGYRFVRWSGEVADSTSASTTVTMTKDITVTANFDNTPPNDGVEMVSIPSGAFLAFEMSKYEITQGQYMTLIGTNPSFFQTGDEYPVEQVSWYDAVKFCNALSVKDGFAKCYDENTWECNTSKNGYRLPTEAEWEYACRAGTETLFYTGNSLSSDGRLSSDLDIAGWYHGNADETHPVGEKVPNSWGLYDMHGNIFEWCNDWNGDKKVTRGGDWALKAVYHQSSYRMAANPDEINYRGGFRIVRRDNITPTTYTITGIITGTDSVTVTLSGDVSDSQTVNDNTFYSFSVDEGGDYTVTPTKTGYTFSPLNMIFNNVTSNRTQDFSASKIIIPVDLTFVTIPSGTFQMGDIEGVGDSDELPVHTVTISSFEMSVYEITNSQYVDYLNDAIFSGDIEYIEGKVYGKTGSFSGERYIDIDYAFDPSNKSGIKYLDTTFSLVDGNENLPVVMISWYGAKAFALYYGYDLPTESEWEYSCRGGQQYKYGTLDGLTWAQPAGYLLNTSGVFGRTEVGTFPANPFGLYDVSGNVYEWCNDWFTVYSNGSLTDPTGASTGTLRISRGGSYYDSINDSRAANRYKVKPSTVIYKIGFRVVRRPGGVTY